MKKSSRLACFFRAGSPAAESPRATLRVESRLFAGGAGEIDVEMESGEVG
jgi:hypothetical protein